MNKERLIERYRQCNVEYDRWWDDTWTEFQAKLLKVGIEARDMHFSGFWSQGDGASFIAKVYQSDMTKFMRRHALVRQFPAAWFWSRRDRQCLYVDTHRIGHHYSHSNTVRPELNDDCGVELTVDQEENDLRRAALEVWQHMLEAEWRDLDEAIVEILRGYMDEFYDLLEEEYYELTSDEAVWDTIEANGWDKDEADEQEAA